MADDETVTIDGEQYDRQAIVDWVAAHDLPADLVPEDGLTIDRDTETMAVKFLACDLEGNLIVDRVRNRFMETGWMEGRYGKPPPDPVYGQPDMDGFIRDKGGR